MTGDTRVAARGALIACWVDGLLMDDLGRVAGPIGCAMRVDEGVVK